MTDITIKYDHGQMLIHLEEFLSCRSISKVRKLIKLINRSDNPDIVNQIKDHIQYRMEWLDNITMITENRIDRNKAEVKDAEMNVQHWLYLRSQHKKGKVLHPNGLSLAVDQIAKESPTYAELGKSANYSLKFNTKNVKMGLIKSKVGTAVV